MTKPYLRLPLPSLTKNLSPKAGAFEDIGLIHGNKLSLPLFRKRKSNFRNSFNLMCTVNQLISCHLFPVFYGKRLLPEIKPSRKLSNHHDGKAFSYDFLF